MKKIFTLLVSLFTISAVFAQFDDKGGWSDNNKQTDYKGDGKDKFDRHEDKFRNTYYFTAREKDMQIAQINRNYDYKIQSVQRKFFMSRFEKVRLIRQLEQQRDCDIKAVNDKFYDRRNLFLRDRKYGHDRW